MTQAAVFKNNQSQAVRLPKAVAFPDDVQKVNVVVLGKSRLLTPAENLWDDWFDQTPLSDFPEREICTQAERESF
ncbi:type II toxin-antitoxin system VapB family antitoxin [Kingella negevensis]|uniref:type II toxin-antitoxin system VapB family antitoxin n=1 Tax=Kingella negevensis TaxID=1522312 RepID=UPI00050A1934|nr:type II toxin-antitoxin system VapB family antitoxin [Kingella negevensis]MDK4688832.1 type II toxin-antitoxin system VapB family antitoxin [Kingella negevensis]WII90046.1 type II toxin-antitoxin system VapB family antitoxin [Kingella negevensis]